MKQVQIIQMPDGKWHVYDKELQMLEPDFETLTDAIIYCKDNNFEYDQETYNIKTEVL